MTTAMVYRAYITVPGLPLEREDLWGPFVARLERDRSELGPVISWDDAETACVVVSMAAESEGVAAQTMYDAVAVCLQDLGMTGLYPARVALEPADGRQPAAA